MIEISKIALENLIIECSKCGNKYNLKEISKELGFTSIFQFEYEFFCKNCEGNKFNIQFEFIPEIYLFGNLEYLIEHLKYNIQICPFCHSNNVIYKKEINKLISLWKCKDCKKEFKLPK